MKTQGKQARSDATRAAVLDAAERLFGANGIEPTPVTEVATEAGRAVGSLYHHFTDKAGLVDAVVDRILDDLQADIAANLEPAQWQGRSILDIVSIYVAVALERESGRPGYKRVLAEVTLTNESARNRHRAIRHTLQEGLVDLFLARRNSIGHPDPDIAVRFVVDQLDAMLRSRLDRTNTAAQLEDTPDDRFRTEAIASIQAYLNIAVGDG